MATLSDQLSWIIFCNRCGLVLYRAQTKSEHGLYFPLGRRFLNQLTIPCLCCDCLRVFIELTGAGAIGKTLDTKYRKQFTREQVKDHLI